MITPGCSAAQKTLGIDLALQKLSIQIFSLSSKPFCFPASMKRPDLHFAYWHEVTTGSWVLQYVPSSPGAPWLQNDARVFLYQGSSEIWIISDTQKEVIRSWCRAGLGRATHRFSPIPSGAWSGSCERAECLSRNLAKVRCYGPLLHHIYLRDSLGVMPLGHFVRWD